MLAASLMPDSGVQVWLKGALKVKQSVCDFGTQNGSKPFYFPWFDLDSPLPWLWTKFLSCCCAEHLWAFVRDQLIEAHTPARIETAVLIETVDDDAASLWSSFHEILGLWFVDFGSLGLLGKHKVEAKGQGSCKEQFCCNPACELRCSHQFWKNFSPLANGCIIQWRQSNGWTSSALSLGYFCTLASHSPLQICHSAW